MRIKSKASQWKSMAGTIAGSTCDEVPFSEGCDAPLQGKP